MQEVVLENEYIDIIKKSDYILFNIKADINLETFIIIKNIEYLKNITNMISSNILFDNEIIKKKKVYLIKKDNSIFNIYQSDNFITIEVKTKYKNDFINEYIIEINKIKEKYKIINMKHDNNYSTYYIGEYNSENSYDNYFKMNRYEALKIFKNVISKLSEINSIDEIIDLVDLFYYLYDKEYKLDNKCNVILNMTLF